MITTNFSTMKKVLFSLVVCSFILSSCSENFIEDLFDKVDGSATSTITDNAGSIDQLDYSNSIVVFDKQATNPYALGLSMNMAFADLTMIEDENDLGFPLMTYRFLGKKFKSGDIIKIDNTLTNEDLVNFDYKSLLNGQYADKNIIGVAVSDSKFYIMQNGTATLTKVKTTKIKGEYSGRAYVISIVDGNPVLGDELVQLSGSFVSRIIPKMAWLDDLQSEID